MPQKSYSNNQTTVANNVQKDSFVLSFFFQLLFEMTELSVSCLYFSSLLSAAQRVPRTQQDVTGEYGAVCMWNHYFPCNKVNIQAQLRAVA